MPHLLGIDIGTSGTKTLVCDADGKVLATAMAEHPISSPKPGWSEQNPEDWWQATIAATKAVLKKAKVKPSDVSAIGLERRTKAFNHQFKSVIGRHARRSSTARASFPAPGTAGFPADRVESPARAAH